MTYKVYLHNAKSPIVASDVTMVATGVWVYDSNTKRVFYPYSSIECVVEEEEDMMRDKL